jgi:hypothetical protein
MKHLFLLALSISIAALHQGCSSSSPPAGGGTSCAQPAGCPTPDPATTELTTPAVTFSADVVPTFQRSCALSSSCHSEKVGGPSQLYLGTAFGQAEDTAGVLAAIVGVPSVELPSMAYVKAGDVANSYLMHKMDGDICQLASQCGSTPAPSCGVVMPQSGCALDGATRDAVRRWIAQGAKND